MGKISHISADESKLYFWNKLNGNRLLFCASSDPVEIATTFFKHGYEDTITKSSSFDFGEEAGFETDDEPSNILDKAFEIYHLVLKSRLRDKGE